MEKMIFKPAFGEKNTPIVFSTDKNYFPYFLVALESIIQNADTEKNYDILVLHTELKENEQKIIQNQIMGHPNFSVRLIDVSDLAEKYRLNDLRTINHLQVPAYYRLLIAEILSHYDKIIYLDCDLVTMQDIAKLYEIDIKDNYLGGVIDIVITSEYILDQDFCHYIKNLGMQHIENYFNSGVLLMNLKAIRQDGLPQKFLEVAVQNTKYFHDQNVLNVICEKKIHFLENAWNVQCQREYNVDHPFILHYCSHNKPWNTKGIIDAEYWWNYARSTFYYEKMLLAFWESIFQNSLKTLIPPPLPINIKHKSKLKRLKYKIIYKLSFGKLRQKYKRKYKESR